MEKYKKRFSKCCPLLFLLFMVSIFFVSTIHALEDFETAPISQRYSEIIDNAIYAGSQDQWEEALTQFTFVADNASSNSLEREEALFGIALSQMSLGYLEESTSCLNMLKQHINDLEAQKNISFELPPEYQWNPSNFNEQDYHEKTRISFLDPNEKISVQDCRDRVLGHARELLTLVKFQVERLKVKIVNGKRWTITEKDKEVIYGEFKSFIYGELLNNAYACCSRCTNNNIWTICVTPLIERCKKWGYLGIPQDPR